MAPTWSSEVWNPLNYLVDLRRRTVGKPDRGQLENQGVTYWQRFKDEIWSCRLAALYDDDGDNDDDDDNVR